VIIFWILTLFVGSSSFAFSYIYLQYDVLSSLFFALIAMLLCRGILTMADPYPEDMPSVPDRRESLTSIAGSA
jgi:hypothetical protein